MKKFIYITLIFISFLNLFPNFVYAINSPIDTSYTTISKSDIPGVAPGGTVSDVSKFLPAVFQLGIGIAGILAVIYIIVGGIQYLSSDAINNKSAGRERIQNALWGLLLAISAYAILSTINPNLVNLNLNIAVLPQGGAISNNLGTSPDNNSASPTGCSNCNLLPAPLLAVTKPPAAQGSTNGACAYPGPCVASIPLESDLNKINIAMGKGGWQITELFPPTVHHIDPCHNNGTCADATVGDQSDTGLVKFFNAIQSSGASSYEYEVCGDPTRLANLMSKQQTVFKNLNVKFACETTTTGTVSATGKVSESVHINQ